MSSQLFFCFCLLGYLVEGRDVQAPTYPWSQRGRDFSTSSSESAVAPSSFENGPSWVWKNELDEQMRHSPLIDNDKNIYVATGVRIRKFSSDGLLRWTWESPASESHMASSAALYQGAIFVISTGKVPIMHSIAMETGKVIWSKGVPFTQNGDASSVFVYNNTVIVPLQSGARNGNDIMFAVNASDGSALWSYVADDVFWNWAPSTNGDGTLLASSSCGGLFRITFAGELVYRKGWPSPGASKAMCDMGGGAMGPNGLFYTVHGRPGTVSAYKVVDGSLVWTKTFPGAIGEDNDAAGTQYPSVGRLGKHGPLVVVAALGTGNGPPSPKNKEQEPLPPAEQHHNQVVVMNAESGDVLWTWKEKPWARVAALGDDEKFEKRKAVAKEHPEVRQDIMCWPDPQGIPVIGGDGTIYTSSGYNGDLRAMKDKNGDGQIDDSEISTFVTNIAFLNSPSMTTGMLVAAPCWGPMFVFKDTEPKAVVV